MVPVLAVVRRHKAAEAVIGEIVAAGSGAGTGPPLHRGDITAEASVAVSQSGGPQIIVVQGLFEQRSVDAGQP